MPFWALHIGQVVLWRKKQVISARFAVMKGLTGGDAFSMFRPLQQAVGFTDSERLVPNPKNLNAVGLSHDGKRHL